MVPRIQQHVERLMRSRSEIFDEANRKRAFAHPPAGEYVDAKRQRVEDVAPLLQMQPTPSPHSLAAVFTLTGNVGLQGFDATQVPAALAARINVKTLSTINQQVLDQALYVSNTRVSHGCTRRDR